MGRISTQGASGNGQQHKCVLLSQTENTNMQKVHADGRTSEKRCNENY